MIELRIYLSRGQEALPLLRAGLGIEILLLKRIIRRKQTTWSVIPDNVITILSGLSEICVNKL